MAPRDRIVMLRVGWDDEWRALMAAAGVEVRPVADVVRMERQALLGTEIELGVLSTHCGWQ